MCVSEKGKLLFGFGESLSNVGPVENVENLVDVLSPKVLVLNVVGVLPYIDAEKRDQSSCSFKGVLVLTSSDLQLGSFLVPSEPAPARS